MCLFSPDTDTLIPLRSRATPDRAPDRLAGGTPAALRDDLISLPGSAAVLSRVTDLVKYATDASPYRLFPQVAVAAESPEQIAKTLQYARQNHHSATFRASGSSLHGQSQGDDILIDVRKCFVGLEVLENGLYAKIKPGMIVNAVNRALLPYGRVLGPDPASSGVATVGGVAANNASGMTAGTKLNSYHTLGLRQEVVDYLTPENRSRQKRLTIYESLSWADKKLLPNLDVKHKARSSDGTPDLLHAYARRRCDAPGKLQVSRRNGRSTP